MKYKSKSKILYFNSESVSVIDLLRHFIQTLLNVVTDILIARDMEDAIAEINGLPEDVIHAGKRANFVREVEEKWSALIVQESC